MANCVDIFDRSHYLKCQEVKLLARTLLKLKKKLETMFKNLRFLSEHYYLPNLTSTNSIKRANSDKEKQICSQYFSIILCFIDHVNFLQNGQLVCDGLLGSWNASIHPTVTFSFTEVSNNPVLNSIRLSTTCCLWYKLHLRKCRIHLDDNYLSTMKSIRSSSESVSKVPNYSNIL